MVFLSRYEERLVELHSVIAELTRQLESKCKSQIQEESGEEDDDDEDKDLTHTEKSSLQGSEGIVSGSADLELDSRTSTDILDARAVEVRTYFTYN